MHESIVFCSACTMSSYRKFTFAISSSGEFLVTKCCDLNKFNINNFHLQTILQPDACCVLRVAKLTVSEHRRNKHVNVSPYHCQVNATQTATKPHQFKQMQLIQCCFTQHANLTERHACARNSGTVSCTCMHRGQLLIQSSILILTVVSYPTFCMVCLIFHFFGSAGKIFYFGRDCCHLCDSVRVYKRYHLLPNFQ